MFLPEPITVPVERAHIDWLGGSEAVMVAGRLGSADSLPAHHVISGWVVLHPLPQLPRSPFPTISMSGTLPTPALVFLSHHPGN